MLVQRAGADLDGLFTSEAARQAAERLGTGSLLAVPMVARRRTRGAILLARADTERPFDQEDVDLADFDAVLRLSDHYGRPILHERERGRDVYGVYEAGVFYRYGTRTVASVPEWERPATDNGLRAQA